MARDRDDDRFDDEAPPRRVDLAAARSRVAVPAVLMILLGLTGLLLELAILAVSVAAPDSFGKSYADFAKPYIEAQPPSPQRDEQLKQVEEMRKLRLDTPVNFAFTLQGAVASGLVFLGGLRMKALKSWGLALVGSAAALDPCGGCLCCAAPVGLWSLLVLMNADVKAAFAAVNGPAIDLADGDAR